MPSPLRRAGIVPACLCLLAFAASSARAQRIQPVFAWPAGASAQTVHEPVALEGLPAAAAATVPQRMEGTYVIAAHPDGLRLTTVTRPLAPAASDDPMRALVNGMSSSVIIVRRTGAFVRLDDTLAVRRRADSVVAILEQSLTARMGGASSPMLQQVVQRTVDRTRATLGVARLSAAARTTWESLVVGFTARAWSPGDSLTEQTVQLNPLGGAGTLPLHRVIHYRGVTACPGGSGTCWRFDSRIWTPPAALRAAMRESMREMTASMAGGSGVTADAIDAQLDAMLDTMPLPVPVTRHETVVDAATLLPLRVETSVENQTARGTPAGLRLRTVTSFRWTR